MIISRFQITIDDFEHTWSGVIYGKSQQDITAEWELIFCPGSEHNTQNSMSGKCTQLIFQNWLLFVYPHGEQDFMRAWVRMPIDWTCPDGHYHLADHNKGNTPMGVPLIGSTMHDGRDNWKGNHDNALILHVISKLLQKEFARRNFDLNLYMHHAM